MDKYNNLDITAKAYSNKLENGEFFGKISLRDLRRFNDTKRYISGKLSTVLDLGCFCGEWLGYLSQEMVFKKCVGVDVSSDKIKQAQNDYPDIEFHAGYAEEINFEEHSFDLVTCLEVLEHIPEWKKVFQTLFGLAKEQVLITVPYKEQIRWQICIHCGKKTPHWGHIHSFSEDDFPDVDGWVRTVSYIKDRGPFSSSIRKIYRIIKPHYSWLAVSYIKK